VKSNRWFGREEIMSATVLENIVGKRKSTPSPKSPHQLFGLPLCLIGSLITVGSKLTSASCRLFPPQIWLTALALILPLVSRADWAKPYALAGPNAAGAIAAVSRIPNSMETWWIGSDGSVWDAFWYGGGRWTPFQLAPAGSASVCGHIAAVSRIPNSMEIWWIGADGSVWDAFWYGGGRWTPYRLAPAGSAALCSGIAAVSRKPNTMEIWWVAPDGSVQDAFWYDDGKNWRQFTLAPANSASTTGGIAALSRVPNTMEIWWIGQDGSVQDDYWYEGFVSWAQPYAVAPRGWASLDGGITALSPRPEFMFIWYVGADGSVQQKHWSGAWSAPYVLAGPQSAAGSTGLSAVARGRAGNTIELWWIGADYSVQDAYWYDTAFVPNFEANWRRFPLSGPLSASTHSGVAAVSRIPESMEVWWVGRDNAVQDAYWYGPFSTSGFSGCLYAAAGAGPPPCIYNVSFDSNDATTVGIHWTSNGYNASENFHKYTEFNLRYGREADDHHNWQQLNFGSDVHDAAIHNLQPFTLYGVIVEAKVDGLFWTQWSGEILFETWPGH